MLYIYIHINNYSLRSIGRVLGVSFQLVAYWIKTGKDKIEKVKKEMIKKEDDKSIYNKKRNIRVLEMDEARSRSCASLLATTNLLVGKVRCENKVGGTCACTMSRACRPTAVCRSEAEE